MGRNNEKHLVHIDNSGELEVSYNLLLLTTCDNIN